MGPHREQVQAVDVVASPLPIWVQVDRWGRCHVARPGALPGGSDVGRSGPALERSPVWVGFTEGRLPMLRLVELGSLLPTFCLPALGGHRLSEPAHRLELGVQFLLGSRVGPEPEQWKRDGHQGDRDAGPEPQLDGSNSKR